MVAQGFKQLRTDVPRPWMVLLLGLLAVFVVVLLVVILLPKVLVTGADLSRKDELTLENDLRTNLIQLLGGAVLLLTAYAAVRSAQVAWNSARSTREAAREGQITEQYASAIDHLGGEAIEVRLGGIYTLERIARASTEDRRPIAEILTAYVRHNGPGHRPSDDGVGLDVQAAMTVLGRGEWGDVDRLNLAGAQLPEVDLHKARLSRAIFWDAHLGGAKLADADLARAEFGGAHLRGADLGKADLSGADFTGADLDQAELWEARIEDARVSKEQLAAAKHSGSVRGTPRA